MRKLTQKVSAELVCKCNSTDLVLSQGYNLPTKAEIKSIVVIRPKVRVEPTKAAEYGLLSIAIENKVKRSLARDMELKKLRLDIIKKSTRTINEIFDRLMKLQEDDFVQPFMRKVS